MPATSRVLTGWLVRRLKTQADRLCSRLLRRCTPTERAIRARSGAAAASRVSRSTRPGVGRWPIIGAPLRCRSDAKLRRSFPLCPVLVARLLAGAGVGRRARTLARRRRRGHRHSAHRPAQPLDRRACRQRHLDGRAPMGASALLVFCMPASPVAQPWAVVGGNVLSALVGIACNSATKRRYPHAQLSTRAHHRPGAATGGHHHAVGPGALAVSGRARRCAAGLTQQLQGKPIGRHSYFWHPRPRP